MRRLYLLHHPRLVRLYMGVRLCLRRYAHLGVRRLEPIHV